MRAPHLRLANSLVQRFFVWMEPSSRPIMDYSTIPRADEAHSISDLVSALGRLASVLSGSCLWFLMFDKTPCIDEARECRQPGEGRVARKTGHEDAIS